jgi:capsular polysaccharide biosynthesis protein
MHYGWIVFLIVSCCVLIAGICMTLVVMIPRWKAQTPIPVEKLATQPTAISKRGCGCGKRQIHA